MAEEGMGYEEPNFGVEKADDIVFPSRPPTETTVDGNITENRPGAIDKEFAKRSYIVSGKQVLAVCKMMEDGRTDEAISTLSDLVPIDLDTPVWCDEGSWTIGELVNAEIEKQKDRHG